MSDDEQMAFYAARIKALEADVKCAWQNVGILERARLAQDAEIERLREVIRQKGVSNG